MSKKLYFLISFVLVLGLAGTASAIPVGTAVAVWNLADANDENGPPFSTLDAEYFYSEPVQVTGAESAEHWDGWAVGSDVQSYTEFTSCGDDCNELLIDGAMSILARVKLGDPCGGADGIIVLTGVYDGSCDDPNLPAYGIELRDGEPTFVVTAEGAVDRTQVRLGQAIDADKWYDIIGIFDPDGGEMRVIVLNSATGTQIGSNYTPVDFNSLYYSSLPELEIFCSPCWELGNAEGSGFIELVAVWAEVITIGTQVSNANPYGGEEHVLPDTELCFQAPRNALCMWVDDPCDPNDEPPAQSLLGPFEYDVWFGSDPGTMVQKADAYLPANCNDVMCFDPCAGDLNLGTWYYWRVDINDANGSGDPCFYEGPVFRFRTWGIAENPSPADGEGGVKPSVILSWVNDGYADSFDVYFGTDAAVVADATTASDPNIYRGPITSPWVDPCDANNVRYLYDIPELLDLLTSYFWRIDEVNAVTVKGDVWSFRTADYFVVDDFEPYTNTAALRAVWKDYWNDPASKNGAEVFVQTVGTDPCYVHAGDKSMKYAFKNFEKDKGKFVGSVAEAATADLQAPTDWTTAGVKALVLYFYGDPCNGKDTTGLNQDQMYVELLSGSKSGLIKYPDMNAITEAFWHEWNIELQDFNDAGMTLSSVDKVYIGFGGQTKTGQSDYGAGNLYGYADNVYFDDIQLHPPRCVPVVAYPYGDLTEDCDIDGQDLAAMLEDWMLTDYEVPPVPPNDANLLVEYLFDTDYTDTSGKGYHGIPSPSGATVSGGKLYLDGVGFVDIPFGADNPFDGSKDFSIAMWFKTSAAAILISSSKQDPCDTASWDHAMGIYATDEGKGNSEVYYDNCYVDWMGSGVLPILDGQWHHMATTYNATTLVHHLYVDGEPEAWPDEAVWDPNIPNIATDTVRIGSSYNPDTYGSGGQDFIGDINDVRIYDYALMHSEVLWLTGVEEMTYFPNTSLANLVLKDPPGAPFDANNVDIVNFKDYVVMAENWLTGPILWPEP